MSIFISLSTKKATVLQGVAARDFPPPPLGHLLQEEDSSLQGIYASLGKLATGLKGKSPWNYDLQKFNW